MTEQKLTCPVCEEGMLAASHFADDFKHHGKTIHVDWLECYVCPNCGADPVFEDQIRRNHLKVADAKRREDGLLTGEQIRAARERLALTQSEAADLFGGGANAFSKYERGDVLQSKSMDRLILLTLRHPFLLEELRKLAGHAEEEWFQVENPMPVRMPREMLTFESVCNAEVIQLNTWKRDAA